MNYSLSYLLFVLLIEKACCLSFVRFLYAMFYDLIIWPDYAVLPLLIIWFWGFTIDLQYEWKYKLYFKKALDKLVIFYLQSLQIEKIQWINNFRNFSLLDGHK